MSSEREAELERREAVARKLERESRVAMGVRSLERQRGVRYVGCRLSTFEIYPGDHGEPQHRVLAELRTYCENISANAADAYGVFLYGPCGSGKDHLAMAVARVFIIAMAEPVRWTSGAELFQELRDSFDGKKGEAEILAPLRQAPLLWISDPLPVKSELSAYEASVLYRIIDQRYSARRPTLITVNMDPGQADEKFGPAIARRLRETTLQLHCNWPSYRRP